MNNLIKVCVKPPQITGYTNTWQDENRQLDNWNGNRNTQLAQIFDGVNLQPERKQPESNMENLVQIINGMIVQHCGISAQFDGVEYHPTELAFVFLTFDNMLTNRAVIACQYVAEALTQHIGKRVSAGAKPYGQQYRVIVWVAK